WRSIIGRQHTDVPVADLSGNASANPGIHNPPGEEEVQRGTKKTGVFDKERTLFWEKNFVALVNGDLRIIRFNLTEIGIHRQIDGKCVFNDDFGVKPSPRIVLVYKHRNCPVEHSCSG